MASIYNILVPHGPSRRRSRPCATSALIAAAGPWELAPITASAGPRTVRALPDRQRQTSVCSGTRLRRRRSGGKLLAGAKNEKSSAETAAPDSRAGPASPGAYTIRSGDAPLRSARRRGGLWIEGYDAEGPPVTTHEHREWVEIFPNSQDIADLSPRGAPAQRPVGRRCTVPVRNHGLIPKAATCGGGARRDLRVPVRVLVRRPRQCDATGRP